MSVPLGRQPPGPPCLHSRWLLLYLRHAAARSPTANEVPEGLACNHRRQKREDIYEARLVTVISALVVVLSSRPNYSPPHSLRRDLDGPGEATHSFSHPFAPLRTFLWRQLDTHYNTCFIHPVIHHVPVPIGTGRPGRRPDLPGESNSAGGHCPRPIANRSLGPGGYRACAVFRAGKANQGRLLHGQGLEQHSALRYVWLPAESTVRSVSVRPGRTANRMGLAVTRGIKTTDPRTWASRSPAWTARRRGPSPPDCGRI